MRRVRGRGATFGSCLAEGADSPGWTAWLLRACSPCTRRPRGSALCSCSPPCSSRARSRQLVLPARFRGFADPSASHLALPPRSARSRRSTRLAHTRRSKANSNTVAARPAAAAAFRRTRRRRRPSVPNLLSRVRPLLPLFSPASCALISLVRQLDRRRTPTKQGPLAGARLSPPPRRSLSSLNSTWPGDDPRGASGIRPLQQQLSHLRHRDERPAPGLRPPPQLPPPPPRSTRPRHRRPPLRRAPHSPSTHPSSRRRSGPQPLPQRSASGSGERLDKARSAAARGGRRSTRTLPRRARRSGKSRPRRCDERRASSVCGRRRSSRSRLESSARRRR